MDQYLSKFFEYLLVNGSSSETIRAYESDLKKIFKYLKDINSKDISLEDIGPNFITVVSETLAKLNLKSASKTRKISATRSFMKFLFLEGVMKSLPELKFRISAPIYKIPTILTRLEVTLLIEAAKRRNFHIGVLIEFLYSTGMRISEALSVRLFDILDNLREIKKEFGIKGKGGKERIVFINSKSRQSLRDLLNQDYNLGTRDTLERSELTSKIWTYTRNRIAQAMKSLSKETGIQAERLFPHVIRHSIAVHLLTNNDGTDKSTPDIRLIQEFLGHKKIKNTQIYLNYVNLESLERLVNSHHPINDLIATKDD